jgi:PAS domain S-box-containing protein
MRAALPQGNTLTSDQWRRRHRVLVWLLWLHVVGLPIVALAYSAPLGHALADGGVIALFAVLGELRLGVRRLQELIVALGLMTCSAVLVHITDGRTEAHFHFFVMVAALALYEDWVPFVVAIVYALVEQSAVDAAFIAALSVVLIVNWRAGEAQRQGIRSLVETLEEGVIMVGREGELLASNPSARRILGIDPAEILRVNGSEAGWTLVGPDGAPLPDAERPLRITARTGEPRLGVPLGLRRADGALRWLSVSTRAADHGPESAPPYRVVVSFSDVTEEREALDALERSNAELEQFAYVASHDLSEPLRMISSYLQLLRRRFHGRLDEDADEFISYAVDGAARMRSLIEDLLAYSRAGRAAEPERVELDRVAGDVLVSLAAAIVEANGQIELGVLPTVAGDRVQLEQLLQNLVGNALKFRSDERAHVWIVAEPAAAGLVQIAVADAGIGIAPAQREDVFGMFQRLHDRQTYAGTGIGLAICRKIVERHGGRIWVDERSGGGSVFRFTLRTAA